MKLTKMTKPSVSEGKDVPGLLQCRIEYEVKTAKGALEYTGPKFSSEMWHQILSFFRWTHKEMDSESQVRLYVNQALKRWGAWAFPQEARTGMSARELPTQETPEKAKERFAYWNSEPSDDWLYFGTVHHHCSASAFQSSTDEQNEWNQDGLHITVGKMDQERHDLHARLYLDGNCFEPDMSRFWEIDADLEKRVPASMLSEVAAFEMCEKVVVNFPDAWRTNVVDVKPAGRSLAHKSMEVQDWELPMTFRLDEAIEEISERCSILSITQDQWVRELRELSASDATQIILEACLRHCVVPDDILEELLHARMPW